MSRHFVLSFRFLSSWFHGRGDGGVPEWPPSPLRAFQAVVAAAARSGALASARAALLWLEQRAAPFIIAPEAAESAVGYRLSVPHNAMDLVGKQWSRGAEGSESEHRTMKSVRPCRLPEDAAVHYVWRLDGDEGVAPELIDAAKGVVALGWGIDLAIGNAMVVDGEQLARLMGPLKLWEPRQGGRCELRVPVTGTLDDLERRHAAFLARTTLADPTLRPPPALATFDIVGYARADHPPTVDVAGFLLMRATSDNLRPFDLARQGMVVAGMLRHTVRVAAERAGWDDARVRASVLGHGARNEARLLLVPAPTIEPRERGGEKVSEVRRVLVFSTEPGSTDTAWAQRALGGMELVDEKTGHVQAVLAATSLRDRVFRRYLTEGRTWVTVTPVVLPGFDDPGGVREKLRKVLPPEERKLLLGRLARRREALVRKALRHAGFGDELAFSAQIEMRETAFIAGLERASRYAVPSHLAQAPRFHVRLTWPVRVPGPICIGSGRFSGLGLFVSVND
jgi:CRISPR-associated protein Csb2